MDKNPVAANFEMLPGAAEAVKKINESGMLAIVATNQPMIAKGFVSFEAVDEVHKLMEMRLGEAGAYVDDIYMCPHHPERGFEGEIPELKIECDCRKPKPGMLLRAAADYHVDLSKSWMIGDRESDMLAGKNAGCRTVLVGQTIESSEFADFRFKNLVEAVDFILENRK